MRAVSWKEHIVKFQNCFWFRQLPVQTSFKSFEQQLGCNMEWCGLAEQRNNQSEFSFEVEELSAKFAGIKEPAKKG